MGIPAGLNELLFESGADVVKLKPQLGEPGIRSSYLGRYRYWPVGSQWPNYYCDSMSFVCQINFAEALQLPGFSIEGMLCRSA